MLDITALFQLSYGIYLITAHDGDRRAGCLVNTVFQVTAEPVRIAVSVSKENQTHAFIEAGGSLAVNVVGEDLDTPLLGKFGYRSGREIDKFEGLHGREDGNGDFYIDEPGILSQFSCRVIGSVDVDTHTVFLCDVTEGRTVRPGAPMTYSYYREVKRLKAGKYAPTYRAPTGKIP